MKTINQTINFMQGIPGFENIREMQLIGTEESYPYLIMKNDEWTFICIWSEAIKDYTPDQGDINILTLNKDDVTINLMGPIVIDETDAMQLIRPQYKIRHSLGNIAEDILRKIDKL